GPHSIQSDTQDRLLALRSSPPGGENKYKSSYQPSTISHQPSAHTLSNVEVQVELVRVWPQADGVHLFLALVPDPGADHVRREHFTLQHELVVLLQEVQRLLQRAGRLGHRGQLFRL